MRQQNLNNKYLNSALNLLSDPRNFLEVFLCTSYFKILKAEEKSRIGIEFESTKEQKI